MRLVVTSDTHTPVDPSFIPDGDVFIHAGDFMTTGYPDDFVRQLEWLAALPHKIKLLVPGNHDLHLQVYPGPALQQLRSVGVTVIGVPSNRDFHTYTLPNGMVMGGLPYTHDLPRWAFSYDVSPTNEMRNHTRRVIYASDIMVTHCPPLGILDKLTSGRRVGMPDLFDVKCMHKIKYWFCGHVHEEGGNSFIDTTTQIEYYNVAMCDRGHNHVTPPLIKDI